MRSSRSWPLTAGVVALPVALVGSARATAYLTIDGRDVANLAGDGNHATFHNPPVNFAYTFGAVTADNPDAGPGDPPGPTETDFRFTGNDFGGLGFGTASAGDLVFPASARCEIDITVNPSNTLSYLFLVLKDADTLSPMQVHLIEELQYYMALGAAGPQTLIVDLSLPDFINTPRDGAPNFEAANGLVELQLLYPFINTGEVLDVTVHEIRIVPGPATPTLVGFAALPALRRRRR